jgi:hypothetical protein
LKSPVRTCAKNLKWAPIVQRAKEIVESYQTGVTLRQLFYRLVVAQLLPNLQTRYRQLSALTAKARRAGTFPDLIDQTSSIRRPRSFNGPAPAQAWLKRIYRREHTEGQPYSLYNGVEKAGMSEQLEATFWHQGLPVLPLGGYASQTLVDDVRKDIQAWKRPAVLIYGGDLDPTGEDIDRDFVERVGLFDKVIRVALNDEQVQEYGLPFNPDPEVIEKLQRDPRAAKFIERHGSLAQYELDALPPDDLMNLYKNAVAEFWDDAAFQRVLRREAKERRSLPG